MTTDKERKRALLLNAAQFYVKPLHSNHPIHALFPPPLIKTLNKIQKNLPRFQIRWRDILPHHDIILLNGRVQDKSKQINLISEGLYLITALSSSHETWSQTTSLSQMLIKNIRPRTLVKGFCNHVKLRANIPVYNVKILQPEKCASFLKKPLIFPVENKPSSTGMVKTKDNTNLWLVGGLALTLGLVIYFTKGKKSSPSFKHNIPAPKPQPKIESPSVKEPVSVKRTWTFF